MKPLNRLKAQYLLHAVADNEASEQERTAFFTFIKNHPDIRREYEEVIYLKKMLSDKLSNQKAPSHIRENVLQHLYRFDDEKLLDTDHKQSLYSVSNESDFSAPNRKLSFHFIAIAASIIFIILMMFQPLSRPGDQHMLDEYIVEYMAAQYFITSGGHFIEPHFKTDSIFDAEHYLALHYGMDITVPTISGAQFAGIIMVDFIDDFNTPLLEYFQTDIEETIYVFAFDVDELHSNRLLVRDKKAVETCIYDSDFFVSEMNEHHSVSWLWNNTWYTAISNHNGYDLASLVEPLNYSP